MTALASLPKDAATDADHLQAALLARRPTPLFIDASPALAVVVGLLLLACICLAALWPSAQHLLSAAFPFSLN